MKFRNAVSSKFDFHLECLLNPEDFAVPPGWMYGMQRTGDKILTLSKAGSLIGNTPNCNPLCYTLYMKVK